MHTSPTDALRGLASGYRARVRAASGHFPEDGGAMVARVAFRAGRYRVAAYATRSRVVLEFGGLDQALCFALGGVYPGVASGRAWLAEPAHAALVAALDLGPGDYVRFYGNRLWASVAPERATAALVPGLVAVADALPSAAPEDPREGADELPPALRPLARYFGAWTESDDEARAAAVRRAGPRRRAGLMAAVAPRLPEIDAYLDASGGEALPPAALRLQQLAEVAAEIRARDV